MNINCSTHSCTGVFSLVLGGGPGDKTKVSFAQKIPFICGGVDKQHWKLMKCRR